MKKSKFKKKKIKGIIDYVKNYQEYQDWNYLPKRKIWNRFFSLYGKVSLTLFLILIFVLAFLYNPYLFSKVIRLGIVLVVTSSAVISWLYMIIDDPRVLSIFRPKEKIAKGPMDIKKSMSKTYVNEVRETRNITIDSPKDLELYQKIVEIYKYLDTSNPYYDLINANMVYLTKLRELLNGAKNENNRLNILMEIDKVKELLMDIVNTFDKEKELSKERIDLFLERKN